MAAAEREGRRLRDVLARHLAGDFGPRAKIVANMVVAAVVDVVVGRIKLFRAALSLPLGVAGVLFCVGAAISEGLVRVVAVLAAMVTVGALGGLWVGFRFVLRFVQSRRVGGSAPAELKAHVLGDLNLDTGPIGIVRFLWRWVRRRNEFVQELGAAARRAKALGVPGAEGS